jgi:triosephosphate isomerase
MRKKIVAGNWKMNMNYEEGIELAVSLDQYFTEKAPSGAEVIICPPFIHLAGISQVLKSGNVILGAQNCASEASGAFTGEVSSDMIKSTGAEYVIIGHSERRTYYNEDDSLLYKKTVLALNSGLKVIFCCGEIKEQREEGSHFEVVKRQIEKGLFPFGKEAMENIIVAYEPVWAIGTGLTATPDQAQEMHMHIRGLFREKYGTEIADKLTILYGGSCKPSNAADIFSRPDVDGGLIGGASLKKEDFAAIVEAMKQT